MAKGFLPAIRVYPRRMGRAEVKTAEVAGTITITIRALERQKEPSVTPIFYKLRQNTALSRHSQELSGIDGHGKESTVTVGSRYCGGVVQLVRTLACHV
jgi:hypothetical protein